MNTNRTIDNTTLFQFEFTDRKKEQEILQNFLDNHSSKVLWIYGKSGTGKTFLFNIALNSVMLYMLKTRKILKLEVVF